MARARARAAQAVRGQAALVLAARGQVGLIRPGPVVRVLAVPGPAR